MSPFRLLHCFLRSLTRDIHTAQDMKEEGRKFTIFNSELFWATFTTLVILAIPILGFLWLIHG